MTNPIENFIETDIIQPVENFFENNPTAVAVETDVSSWFKQAVSIIENNGGSLLIAAATNVVPAIISGQWGVAVANVLADAKAAGAVTVPAEESLAAALALQAAQTIAGTSTPSSPEPVAPTDVTA
jgi:hypothetical protein